MNQLTDLIPSYLVQLFQVVLPWWAGGIVMVTVFHFYGKWNKADDDRR